MSNTGCLFLEGTAELGVKGRFFFLNCMPFYVFEILKFLTTWMDHPFKNM